MIDYDKLKLAHELAEKLSDIAHACIWIKTINYSDGLKAWVCNHFDGQMGIDDLIAKLQELTQPTAKYKEGDEVWTYSHGHINPWEIEKIRWESGSNDFRLDLKQNFGKGSFLQCDCYPTKSQLIEAQIEYWQSQKPCVPCCGQCHHPIGFCDCKKECQHESDGCCYIDECAQSKCLKCGEFYK